MFWYLLTAPSSPMTPRTSVRQRQSHLPFLSSLTWLSASTEYELSAPPSCPSEPRLPGPPVCPAPDVAAGLQRPAGSQILIGPSVHRPAQPTNGNGAGRGECPHPRWRPQELGAGDRRRGSGLGWPSDCGVPGACRGALP